MAYDIGRDRLKLLKHELREISAEREVAEKYRESI